MPDWSAQQTYKVDRSLADLLLPIRVGLTQKYSKKEWNGESSEVLGQRRLTFETEHEPISAIPGSF